MTTPEELPVLPFVAVRPMRPRALVTILVLLLATLPVPSPSWGSLRIAVISDLNGSYGSSTYGAAVDGAVARILELKPDLVISTGDMVAGQRRPHLSRVEVERMWSAFHAHVSERLAAAGIPLAVTPGNHDGSAYHGFERERRVYAEQWLRRKPSLEFVDDSHYPFYYAFAVQDALVLSLDATTVGHLHGEQMDWLRQVLEKYGPAYEQRVAFSHVPLWPFAMGREREYIGDPALEQLLQGANVGLYLSGHHHVFYPGHKGGIDLVSQACLGAGPRRLIGSGGKSPLSFTMIELTADDTMIAALQAPDFRQSIEWTDLPPDIRSATARMVRADLVTGGARQMVIERPDQ